MKWINLTLSDIKRATSLNSFTYQLSSQFVLTLPNFYLSEFSTPKDYSYLDHGIIFCVRSLWNSTSFGNSTNCLSPFTVNHVMNVIFTALLTRKYCLPSRRSSSKLPFLYQKIFHVTEALNRTRITMFFRIIKEIMGLYECFSDVCTTFLSLLTAPPYLKERHFSSYDDPALIDLNCDISAISKL
jgi:hypothetical protein